MPNTAPPDPNTLPEEGLFMLQVRTEHAWKDLFVAAAGWFRGDRGAAFFARFPLPLRLVPVEPDGDGGYRPMDAPE